MDEQNAVVGRVGYWLSEKKSKKFNLDEFQDLCTQNGIELVKIDLSYPLESQGPFSAIIHKLTDVIAQANFGDPESLSIIQQFEQFSKSNPTMHIVDPFENLRHLLDRYKTYSTISTSDLNRAGEVLIPPFVELTSLDTGENVQKLRDAGVRYPFVCKHIVAHGSRKAHQMAIVFHEGGVKDCEPPCVAQTFIAHDALLFKIFVVGSKYFIVERPSLKNFVAEERETIFFDSHDVSKPDSASSLSILDEDDEHNDRPKLKRDLVEKIVSMLRRALKMSLFGVDIVLEKNTGHYAIIDINAFPGYEGVPDFFLHVTNLLKELISKPVTTESEKVRAEEDSGIETGDSSDEKRIQDANKGLRVKRSSLNLSS